MLQKCKKPRPFQVGDGLFQGDFAWFSSTCSHMGQQTDVAGRFHLFGHKNAPLSWKCKGIIPWERAFVDRKTDVF